MKVFHGSSQQIETPLIIEPNRALDFGPGFYTTLNEAQASEFAKKVMDRLHSSQGFVNVYEVDIKSMRDNLNYLWFDEPNGEWLDYVSNNRNGIATETVDFSFGPVANDDVYRTFAAYQAGILTREETIARLKIKPLYDQLTFKSEASLKYIHFTKAYTI